MFVVVVLLYTVFMLRISLRCKGLLRSFLSLHLSLGMHGDFLISSVYAVTFDVFNVWLPKAEKEKNEGGGRAPAL